MGFDPISSASPNTTIYSSIFNKMVQAIKQDLVPRNGSGVAQVNAGSLGSTTFPWLKMFFGAAASQLSIEESAPGSGILRLRFGSNNYFDISTTELALTVAGVRKFTANATTGIDRQFFGAPNYVKNNVNNYSNATGTLSTVGEVTITTNGRPVMVAVSGGQVAVDHQNITASPSIAVGGYSLSRVGLGTIGGSQVTIRHESSTMPTRLLTQQPFSIVVIDTPPAGTHTYRLSASFVVTSGGGTGSISFTANNQFFAQEM